MNRDPSKPAPAPAAAAARSGSQKRRAAIRVADRIAAEHPNPLDDTMPRHAGRTVAHDPQARTDLLELLDALDLRETR